MTLIDFIKEHYDKTGVGDTPQNVNQCVGLVEVYLDALNLPHVWGNAKDLLANADPNSYDIIYNTPEGKPSFGDIFVFGSDYGSGVGHTGIVVAASTNIVTLFEQNDGLNGGTPQFKTYTYGATENDAIGWLHPKGVVVDDQATIDALRNQRDTNWNLYQADEQKIKDLSVHEIDLNSQIEDLKNQLQEVKDTQVQIPVQTTDGETNVPVVIPSTPTPEVLPSTSGDNMSPVETKPIVPHDPVKPRMDIASTIVWVGKNIFSVLIKLWKNLNQK